MKNLFRKLRQKILGNNKFTRYLLYAFGEIILVVIGILIAIQFNNWRLEKSDREIERKLLLNLKSDLSIDIQEFENVKAFKISQDEAALRILEYMIDEKKPLTDTLQFLNDLSLIIYFIVPSSNRTSFDIATSTAYLNNITNDQLIKDLSNYYNNIGLEQHVTETNRFINAFSDNYLLSKYRLFSNKVRALDGQGGDYELERYRNDQRPTLLPRDIRGDVSLENYLNSLSLRLKIGVKGLEKEANWATTLINAIDEHLKLMD